MRVLKYGDYINSCVFTEEMVDLALAIIKLDLVKILSDFQGNLFYEIQKDGYSIIRPLNVCITELRDSPEMDH